MVEDSIPHCGAGVRSEASLPVKKGEGGLSVSTQFKGSERVRRL